MLFLSCLGLADSSVDIWVFGEENWKRNPTYVLVSTENGLFSSNVWFSVSSWMLQFQFPIWKLRVQEEGKLDSI
jgi:hypothetical protein